MPTRGTHSEPAIMDLHVHSTCSGDGASSIADYAQRALDLGLVGVGFCEHADFDPRDRSYDYLDPERYASEIAAARAETPAVRLGQGVEITYQASREDEIRAWLGGHDWDYVVASVHLVDYTDGWAMVMDEEPNLAKQVAMLDGAFGANICRSEILSLAGEGKLNHEHQAATLAGRVEKTKVSFDLM